MYKQKERELNKTKEEIIKELSTVPLLDDLQEKIKESSNLIYTEKKLIKLWELRSKLLNDVEIFLNPLSDSERAGYYNIIYFPISPILNVTEKSNLSPNLSPKLEFTSPIDSRIGTGTFDSRTGTENFRKISAENLMELKSSSIIENYAERNYAESGTGGVSGSGSNHIGNNGGNTVSSSNGGNGGGDRSNISNISDGGNGNRNDSGNGSSSSCGDVQKNRDESEIRSENRSENKNENKIENKIKNKNKIEDYVIKLSEVQDLTKSDQALYTALLPIKGREYVLLTCAFFNFNFIFILALF